MGLSLFILASIGGVFRAQTHTIKGQESRMEAHEYALTVIDVMIREIRNAGYFPSTACDATGGITSASATSISFQYDRDGDGVCSGDRRGHYLCVRRIKCHAQSDHWPGLSDGNVTAVQFTYYPQQTSGTAATRIQLSLCPLPTLPPLRKIAISLTVQPKSTDSQFTGSAVTMSATADLRNHGL